MKKKEGQNKSVWMGVVGGNFRPHHRFVADPTFGLKASGAPQCLSPVGAHTFPVWGQGVFRVLGPPGVRHGLAWGRD